MDKRQLQEKILQTSYKREKWIDVLQNWFGAKPEVRQIPETISRDTQLWSKYVENAVALGKISTDSGEREVGIFEVALTEKAWLERNRVTLRNLLNSLYGEFDGALIVFKQGNKWRFTYVSEIRERDENGIVRIIKTEPKRYTYFLGDGENCRTAADRFDRLKGKLLTLADLNEAFSVEKLSKDFFKEYKTHFEKFWKFLADNKSYYKLLSAHEKEDEDKKTKPIRDFVKVLLGRLVFLQFLQKKGWMGVPANRPDWEGGDFKFIQNLFAGFHDKAHFHSTALKTLFFETLNRKRLNDLAPTILGTNIKIPYLNGGLFDADVSEKNAIDFPAEFFRDLLGFFEQYNFTIDESDAFDREVGIDPEMLGHIFENLLEENREKGAFYTPKEIVHYMCQESLIEYLSTHLIKPTKSLLENVNEVEAFEAEAANRNTRTDIEIFVQQNYVSDLFADYRKANEIDSLLKQVKICDPAIGSGAFPMGLLKEIFECRRVLYGYLKSNEPFNPTQIKKEIIQNNIYGVDIEPGAVDIARLRFWLSLVVDEIEPQPLPNLDYKIMQGNSLLERFDDIDLSCLASADETDARMSDVVITEQRQLGFGEGFARVEQPQLTMTVFDQATKAQLQILLVKYFDLDEWNRRKKENLDKADLKRQINEIVEGKIHAFIFAEKMQLESEIRKVERKWINAGYSDFSRLNQKTREFKNYESLKKQLARLDATEKRLIELQDKPERPYFLWHLWFKDIFDKGGFDIVIGNPPFGAKLTFDEKEIFKHLYSDVHMRTPDTFNYFISLSFKLLRKNGVLSFITPNNLLFQNENEKTRDLLINKKRLVDVINLGDNTFENADVPTCIFIVKNETNPSYLFSYKDFRKENIKEIDWFSGGAQYESQTLNEIPGLVFGVSNTNLKIFKQIEAKSWLIDEIAEEVASGISTGGDKIFRLPKADANRLKLEKDLLHPVLVGGEIDKYKIKDTKHVIIYSTKNADVPSHTNIFEYLEPFEEKLSQKRETRKGILPWWCLHWSRYKELFLGPKIILRQTSDSIRATIDLNNYFVLNSILVVKFKDDVKVSLKYALSILNSRLTNFIYKNLTQEEYRAFAEVKPKNVRKLLVPRISIEEQQAFEVLVDYLLFLNDENNSPLSSLVPNSHIAKIFEEILDGCVYELCFEEHMRSLKINILDYVKETMKPIEKLHEQQLKAQTINQVFQQLRRSENPIRNRIQLFVTSSPDILKPIIQS